MLESKRTFHDKKMQVLILLKIIYLGIIWEECSNSVHLVFDHDYPKPTVTVTRQKQH